MSDLATPDAAVQRGPLTATSILRRISFGRYTGVVIGLVAVCVYLWITQPVFMSWDNWQNIIRSQSVVAVLALGMTFVVLTAGIDLSVASATAAASMMLGQAITHGWHWVPAALLCIVAGLALGLINGLLIGVARISLFVVTLGTLSIYQSIALLTTQGETTSFSGVESFTPISNLTNNAVGPFPNLLLLIVGLYLVGGFVLRFTHFGRSIFAVGSNADAARLTGIKVNVVLVSVYALAGLTVGIGAVVQSGRLTAANPTADPNLMLSVVAAVLIGGTAFSGGDGSLIGTLIGVLFLGVIQNGLALSGISTFWQGTISGVILIAAVSIAVVREHGWLMTLARTRSRGQPGP